MKIVLFDYVFDQQQPGISGLSDLIWDTARGLVEIGEEVHIVGPYPDGTNGPKGATLHTYPLPRLNYRNLLGHLLIIWHGWRVIQRELSDADLIHTPEYLSSGAFTLMGKIPVILTTPGSIYERIYSGANPFDPVTTAIYKLAAHISARRCAYIIAISQDMKRWWEYSGAATEKILVLPFGVDTDIFTSQSEVGPQIDWSTRQRHILFTGRLSIEKGVDLLLEAFSRAVQQFPDIHLHIVGDGPQRERYQNLAEQLGISDAVTFYGWIKKYELPLYYAAADVCIVPSRSEPLGRVILESMACATPVIGADTGGIPDLITHNETGMLFPPDNSERLYDCLAYFLELDTTSIAEMGQRARDFMLANQTLIAVAYRIRDDVYRPLVAAE